MTYKFCKGTIEATEKKGAKTPEYIADMRDKLDIFLLANRVTDDEYRELNAMLDVDTE